MKNDKKTDLVVCVEKVHDILVNQKEDIQEELEKCGFAVVNVKANKCMIKIIVKSEDEQYE